MPTRKAEYRVVNLDCDRDAAAIERGLRSVQGVLDLNVYRQAAKVSVQYDPDSATPEAIAEKLDKLGFPAQRGRVEAQRPRPLRNPKVLASIASGVLLLGGWLASLVGAPHWASFAVYVAAVLIGGYYFGREAIEELIFEHEVGIELLMSLAAVTATVMGAAGEGAMLVFLYSISEAAEGYTEEKTRSAIKALMDLSPRTALVRRDGGEIEIPVEELAVGDVFIVKPGQAIATDGEVIAGASSVNQAPVTGESAPVDKVSGDPVFAGSLNSEGALEVRATKTAADNTIARMIQLVEEAQERKGHSQRFIERFGHRYSPAVLLGGVLIAVGPPLLLGDSWPNWINRATVFIVAAAPCALVISIPVTLVASLGTGARNGVLIKGGIHIEELAKITVVALDKTGTLTHGQPEVTDLEVIPAGADALSRETVLSIAAGIERWSQHPLARAILRFAELQAVEPAVVTEFLSITGAGAKAKWNDTQVYAGSPKLFAEVLGAELNSIAGAIAGLQAEGKTVILVGRDRRVWGLFGIRDNLRTNAPQSVAQMHAAGVRRVVMLTGDNRRTAEAIAHKARVDEVHSDLKPEDKVAKVRELTERYGHVAMVGDGINDAPALAEATVGVAMGAAGTDVALETADVALMADDLEKFVYAFTLARRNQLIVRQNLALSAIVISALVLGAVSGQFSLPIAVLGHEVSELAVIANGLRMLRS